MYPRSFRTLICGPAALAVAAVIMLADMPPLAAQQPPPATQTPPVTPAPSPQVLAFLNTPGQLLQQFPNGGVGLTDRIRELAVADQATFSVILGLFANATKEQKTAIAKGLAQAAKIVVKTNRAYAAEIQQAIAISKDQDVVLAFLSETGDTQTGGVGGGAGGGGGGGGGAGGGVGGQTNALPSGPSGTSGLEAINGSGLNTGNFTITSSVSGTSGVSSSVSP